VSRQSVLLTGIGLAVVSETRTAQGVLPGVVLDETAVISHVWNASGIASAAFFPHVVSGKWNADGTANISFAGYSTYSSGTWNANGAGTAVFASTAGQVAWNADGAAAVAFAGRVTSAPFHADGNASVLWPGQRAFNAALHADGASTAAWTGRGAGLGQWNADGTATAGWLVASPHVWNADGLGSAAWTGVDRVNAVWNADGAGLGSWAAGSLGGPFYFAWINPGEVWGPQHLRIDEVIFSFNLQHDEGQCATLEIEVKNPFTGFLAPGRKQWAYFSIHSQALFQGRLISVPGDVTGEVVTLHFTAMPLDMLNQQRALADTLQVRPYWDPVWIAEAQRLDPMSVLEGYSAMWHVDRVTLQVTASDLLVGENGLIQFGDGTSNDVFYDSVKPSVEKAPLRSVYVDATVSWTQYAIGTMDMGKRSWSAWSAGGIVGSWPKAGTDIGSGWTVNHSLAIDPSGQVHTATGGYSYKAAPTQFTMELQEVPARHKFGDLMSLDEQWSIPSLVTGFQNSGGFGGSGGGSASFITSQTLNLTIGDPYKGIAPAGNASQSGTTFFNWTVNTTLTLRYQAKRERTENVRFMLTADLQPVFTDPGGQAANFAQDSEYLKLDGKVGLEGPYGTFKGAWQPRTDYKLYDILITTDGKTWQVLRDHRSLDTFDSQATAGVAVARQWYDAGDNIYIDNVSGLLPWLNMMFKWWDGVSGYTTSEAPANPHYWTVLISGYFPGSLNITSIRDPFTQTPIYAPLGNVHSGKQLYQQVPQFRGNWTAGEILLGNDMVIAPDGTWYRVAIGHVAKAPFYKFASNVAGQLLYELMLNPPPIGDISRRSYFPQERGLWSLENLIARARAHIIARSRVLKVAFECRFEALLNLSLRNNAELFDRRLPGGVALGKVTSYSIKGNGDQGSIIGGVTISCAAGQANAVNPATGTPEYADADYTGNDYQFFDGAITVLGTNDVSYTRPVDVGSQIDDGLVFPLTQAQAVVAEAITVLSNDIGGVA
jgi:hypothetical protein